MLQSTLRLIIRIFLDPSHLYLKRAFVQKAGFLKTIKKFLNNNNLENSYYITSTSLIGFFSLQKHNANITWRRICQTKYYCLTLFPAQKFVIERKAFYILRSNVNVIVLSSIKFEFICPPLST